MQYVNFAIPAAPTTFGPGGTSPNGGVVYRCHIGARSAVPQLLDRNYGTADLALVAGPYASNSGGDVKLTGQLRNNGTVASIFSKVFVALKNSQGEFLDVDFTYADGQQIGGSSSGIPAGTAAPFTMYTQAPFTYYFYSEKRYEWDDYGTPPPTCTYSISPTSQSFSAAGGSGNFQLSTQTNCSWTASTNYSWIRVTSASSGTGSAQIQYVVDPNNTASSRTGTVVAGGKSFSVHQEGLAGCTYSINPTSMSFDHNGGNATVGVTTQAGCSWQATRNRVWISFPLGGSGTGSGVFTYSVEPNDSPDSRSGSINLEGERLSITQSGMPTPDEFTYTVGGIAHAGGAGGSTWRSTFNVSNPSNEVANLELEYRFGGGSRRSSLALAAGSVFEWNDVATDLFGLSSPSSGLIEVISDVDVVVSARTFNDSAIGTFGQYMPAVTSENKLDHGEVGILSQVKKTVEFRCNVGFVNLEDVTTAVRVTLFDQDGIQIGTPVSELISPNQWTQINDVFAEASVQSCQTAYATVEVTTAGSSVWAYASVVDNNSGDPTTIPVVVQ